jgi:apolipoprotein N-acyltransferase
VSLAVALPIALQHLESDALQQCVSVAALHVEVFTADNVLLFQVLVCMEWCRECSSVCVWNGAKNTRCMGCNWILCSFAQYGGWFGCCAPFAVRKLAHMAATAGMLPLFADDVADRPESEGVSCCIDNGLCVSWGKTASTLLD